MITLFQIAFTVICVGISRLEDGEYDRIFAIVDKCGPSLGHCIINKSYDKLDL